MIVAPSIDKGTYRHTKSGKTYDVIGVSYHTETEEFLVVYRPLYVCEYEFFTRPYDMFTETIELNGNNVPRFEKINE